MSRFITSKYINLSFILQEYKYFNTWSTVEDVMSTKVSNL